MTFSSRTGLLVLVALVMARSAVFVWWPQSHFDADQAITGLMAKHLAEGRAFPVFQYGHRYMLVIEPWLAAPLFLLTGQTSVTVLKSVPAMLNIAAIVLLYRTLVRGVGLSPATAVLAALPVAVPGPIATATLTGTVGMSIEQIVFALLLWNLRGRPVALGIAAAIAVLNREFTVYAIVALVITDAMRERRPEYWRDRLVALVAFALAWTSVGVLARYSSPDGPGTTYVVADATTNVDVVTAFACFEPGTIPRSVRSVLTHYLPVQLGSGPQWLARGSINSSGWQGSHELWPLPLALILIGAARGAWRAWREGPQPATWFGLYLLLVGVQAAFVYATLRCGYIGMGNLRYLLLSLLAPVGALVLAFERESSGWFRGAVAGAVMIWIGSCAADHVRLLREYIVTPPSGPYLELAEYLDSRGVRYIQTDYWTGYQIVFLTDERVKPLTSIDRVREYALEVQANADQVVEVRRLHQERCPGGVEVAEWVVCPPASAGRAP